MIVQLPGGEEAPETEANTQEAPQDKRKALVKSIMNAESDSEGSSESEAEGEGKGAKNQQQRLIKPRDFDSYTYHVPHIELKSSVMVSQKLLYIFDEAMSDLGFRNLRSINFWISLLVLIMAMWSRAYMHTFGSWVLLKLASVAISTFDPMMYLSCSDLDRYGFALEYATRNVGVELGVILCGNLFNTLIFSLLILLSWSFQRFSRRAPRMVYKFVASYGIATIFDFLLIGIVDIIRCVPKF